MLGVSRVLDSGTPCNISLGSSRWLVLSVIFPMAECNWWLRVSRQSWKHFWIKLQPA